MRLSDFDQAEMNALAEEVADGNFLTLIRRFPAAGVIEGGVVVRRPRPQAQEGLTFVQRVSNSELGLPLSEQKADACEQSPLGN